MQQQLLPKHPARRQASSSQLPRGMQRFHGRIASSTHREVPVIPLILSKADIEGFQCSKLRQFRQHEAAIISELGILLLLVWVIGNLSPCAQW